jgi:hypothetical protein
VIQKAIVFVERRSVVKVETKRQLAKGHWSDTKVAAVVGIDGGV